MAPMLAACAAVLACAALSAAHGQLDEGGVEMVSTELSMSIPEGNTMPWAFVEGTVPGHAPGYPVIIQIYSEGGAPGNSEGAVHFAQAEVSDDGSYEHRFRVLDVTGGERTAVFEGDYTVKVFKFVYARTL